MAPRPQCDEDLSPSTSGDGFLPAPSSGAEANKRNKPKSKKSAAMPRATSMLEMSDIHDMLKFGEEMMAMAAKPAPADQDDDDDGFFIDISPSEEDGHNVDGGVSGGGGGFLGLPSVEGDDDGPDIDGTFHVPASQGGMRRVMSMASLPSSRVQRLGLCAVAPIQTISEEEIMDGANRARTTETGLDSSISGRRAFLRTSSSSSSGGPNGSFRRTSSSSSFGGLRRSSLRGSANNLRSAVKSSDSVSPEDVDTRINQRVPETGLDESISIRAVSRVASRTPETGLDESVTTRRVANMKRSGSSANMRRSGSSASMHRMPSRSSMKGSSNNLRSSLKSVCSKSSVPSMDDTNHSLESSDGEAGRKSRSNSMKRNVSFASLEIRSYDMTLGDAPTVNGPPVTLSWTHSATEEYDLDQYENARGVIRRNKQEMQMPASHRQYLLMRDAGFSRGEIKTAMVEAQRCAKQRERTAKNVRLGLQPMEEAFEKTKRKLSFRKKR